VVLKKFYKYLEPILGMALVAIAFNLIIEPMKIAVGGTNGIAIIFEKLLNIEPALFIQIFYVFTLLLSVIILGFKKTRTVLLGTILYPIFVEVFKNITSYIKLEYDDKLLMFLVAAALIGVGEGLIFKNGFACGGTDIIKRIINEKLKIQMGKCVFLIDTIIVISGGFVFGIRTMLYAIIIIYISSKITDKVILGISSKKMFYIMTNKPQEVKEYITQELKYGITELGALGGYTDTKQKILMCVIPTRDYIKLEDRVNDIDPSSFFVITDTYHTYHNGE
jgi:uncharacterized membrane-anchored protein YitT (DUF2179 family)